MTKKSMTKKERDHVSRVVEMGCIVCVNLEYGETPAEAHHIGNGAWGTKATSYEVIPLCPTHHRTGGYGVAVHSGRMGFEEKYGTEQELLAQTLDWLNL